MNDDNFKYADERFADLQLLRYRLDGFEKLSLRQKQLVYWLSQATLYGRDITFDQFGKYNLRIRKMLEAVFLYYKGTRETDDFHALEIYLKRIWFSNGIYHHYGCEKIVPQFDMNYLRSVLDTIPFHHLPLRRGETIDDFCNELFPVIFDSSVLPKRVNKANGEDLIRTSACNLYESVTQEEVEKYYALKKEKDTGKNRQPSWGLNSKLVKEDGQIKELVWKEKGMYGTAIGKIIECLRNALDFTENDKQNEVIRLLISYYQSGDLKLFDEYSIKWVQSNEGQVDFINGFIEVYGDPMGLKGTWEGIVEFKDLEATKRTQTISNNAQWFEDHSPVDTRFKKVQVKGVTANAVCAAMLGGEEYPSTAIGINLPNAEWIRAQYGSKSVTISNLTAAYNQVAKGNGFREEFVIDSQTCDLIDKYGDICEELHTDLHECLGHGSGKLLSGTDPDALKAYGNTIEEARADLFGLYYIADEKLIELGLVPDKEAYKSQYYTYMMNGLMTQLTRILPSNQIEEDHMRNRALIAHWTLEHSQGVVEVVRCEGKSFVKIHDYSALRTIFARLLAEIQRIKSEGDFSAARDMVEKYAVRVDAELHKEVLARYKRLDLAPYKGFINPVLRLIYDKNKKIVDVGVDYTETYAAQMLRYSQDYGTL